MLILNSTLSIGQNTPMTLQMRRFISEMLNVKMKMLQFSKRQSGDTYSFLLFCLHLCLRRFVQYYMYIHFASNSVRLKTLMAYLCSSLSQAFKKNPIPYWKKKIKTMKFILLFSTVAHVLSICHYFDILSIANKSKNRPTITCLGD